MLVYQLSQKTMSNFIFIILSLKLLKTEKNALDKYFMTFGYKVYCQNQ